MICHFIQISGIIHWYNPVLQYITGLYLGVCNTICLMYKYATQICKMIVHHNLNVLPIWFKLCLLSTYKNCISNDSESCSILLLLSDKYLASSYCIHIYNITSCKKNISVYMAQPFGTKDPGGLTKPRDIHVRPIQDFDYHISSYRLATMYKILIIQLRWFLLKMCLRCLLTHDVYAIFSFLVNNFEQFSDRQN